MVEVGTKPLPEIEFVKASLTEIIKPNQHVDCLPFPKPGDWYEQRLGERTYWVHALGFSFTVFVGEKGALLIDAPHFQDIPGLLAAVARITPLPVTTLVYSHSHLDHMGLGGRLKAVMKEKAIDLRVIASETCATELARYKNAECLPTETLPVGRQTFMFEQWEFRHITPVAWAHCGADSYTITPDKVIHFVDFVHPGRLPMCNVSGVQNMTGYLDFLRHVAGEDWSIANLGHANVGCMADVTRTLDYFTDLYDHWFEVLPPFSPAMLSSGPQNHGVFIRNFMDMAAQLVATRAQDKWGHITHFEVARDHAEAVSWDLFLNYDFLTNPSVRPDFDPIKAR